MSCGVCASWDGLGQCTRCFRAFCSLHLVWDGKTGFQMCTSCQGRKPPTRPATQPADGWYPDPLGAAQERRRRGFKWTSDVRTAVTEGITTTHRITDDPLPFRDGFYADPSVPDGASTMWRYWERGQWTERIRDHHGGVVTQGPFALTVEQWDLLNDSLPEMSTFVAAPAVVSPRGTTGSPTMSSDDFARFLADPSHYAGPQKPPQLSIPDVLTALRAACTPNVVVVMSRWGNSNVARRKARGWLVERFTTHHYILDQLRTTHGYLALLENGDVVSGEVHDGRMSYPTGGDWKPSESALRNMAGHIHQ